MPKRKSRKRKYIPLPEKLAATLAMLLTQAERDALRAAKVPAKGVISLFTFDHGILHALAGADKWWNLTPKRRGRELKAKDGRDTSIVAKVKRVSAEHEDFRRRVLAPVKRPREKRSRFPQGRKLQSRGFQRRSA